MRGPWIPGKWLIRGEKYFGVKASRRPDRMGPGGVVCRFSGKQLPDGGTLRSKSSGIWIWPARNPSRCFGPEARVSSEGFGFLEGDP